MSFVTVRCYLFFVGNHSVAGTDRHHPWTRHGTEKHAVPCGLTVINPPSWPQEWYDGEKREIALTYKEYLDRVRADEVYQRAKKRHREQYAESG